MIQLKTAPTKAELRYPPIHENNLSTRTTIIKYPKKIGLSNKINSFPSDFYIMLSYAAIDVVDGEMNLWIINMIMTIVFFITQASVLLRKFDRGVQKGGQGWWVFCDIKFSWKIGGFHDFRRGREDIISDIFCSFSEKKLSM